MLAYSMYLILLWADIRSRLNHHWFSWSITDVKDCTCSRVAVLSSWPNVPVSPGQSRFRARCPGVPKGHFRDAFMSRFAESRPNRGKGHHLWQWNRLQSVLNAVARLVYSAQRSKRVSPLLFSVISTDRVPQRIKYSVIGYHWSNCSLHQCYFSHSF